MLNRQICKAKRHNRLVRIFIITQREIYLTYVNGLQTNSHCIKGRVHCFSMQVLMNKNFLLNLEKKIWRKSVLSFSRKTQKTHL